MTQGLCTSVAVAALALSFVSPAFAEEAPRQDGSAQLAQPGQSAPEGPTSEVAGPGGEIIVTANKRAENVQDVPLAVSVVAPAQLAAAGVRNFADLGKISPSLVVRPAEQPQNSNVSLRGVGTFAFGIGVESSVAVLIDEVPLAFQARAFTDLPDVERIEVLRGPQSTLYGKSASAGLVNIITREPTKDLRIRANGVLTTDEEYGANFSISGPASETIGYVVSAAYNYWDGNVRNLFNDKEVNGRESINLRGKLRWEPTDDQSLTVALNYINGNTDVGRPFVNVSPNARLRGVAALTPAVVFPGVTPDRDNQDISNNFNSRTEFEGGGGYIRGEIGLGRLNLVSISSYDRFHLDDYLDQDDTSLAAGSAPMDYGNNNQIGQFDSEQFTQEIRLQSPTEDPFRYTLGVYFAHVEFERPFQRGPVFALANWFATSQSRQIAGFAQLDWSIVPELTVTAGGRVQNERVSYSFQDNLAAGIVYRGRAEDTAGTYKGSVRYEFTPDISAFATFATGYKGQTYDLTTGFNRNRADAGPIRPERSYNKEIGIRSQFLDRRLTLNVTLFDTLYRNLQAQTIENLADGSFNYRLTNVGRLTTKGVEFEGSLRPSDDFSVGGALTYLDAKYATFPVAQCYPLQTAALGCTGTPGRQNLSGTRVTQAPEWKFTVNADYSPQLSETLRGVAQVNWQYQSSLFFAPRDPELFQDGYHIVNIGLGVRDEERRWEVVGFVNNLFDQQYFGALVNTAGNFGNNIATQAVLPRDFKRYGGVRVGLNF